MQVTQPDTSNQPLSLQAGSSRPGGLKAPTSWPSFLQMDDCVLCDTFMRTPTVSVSDAFFSDDTKALSTRPPSQLESFMTRTKLARRRRANRVQGPGVLERARPSRAARYFTCRCSLCESRSSWRTRRRCPRDSITTGIRRVAIHDEQTMWKAVWKRPPPQPESVKKKHQREAQASQACVLHDPS